MLRRRTLASRWFGQYTRWWRFKAKVLVYLNDHGWPERFPKFRKWLCDRGIHALEGCTRLRKPTSAPSTWYTEHYDACKACGEEV